MLPAVLLLVALLGAGPAAGVLTAGPASAHATVVTTTPADGARLAAAPAEVSVQFDEDVSLGAGYAPAWIEPTVDGQPEPERPAPALSLSADAPGGDSTGAAAAGTPGAEEADGNGTAVAALVVAIVGLVAGLAGPGLGLSARRRTVSP